jgi:hypothetical protein
MTRVPAEVHAARRRWYEHRYGLLLATLLLLPIVHPAFHTRLVSDGLLFLILMAVVYAVRRDRRSLVIIGLLALPALVAISVGYAVDRPYLVAVAAASCALFLIYTALVVLGDVFRRGRIDVERLFGAMCVYLLLGLAWTFLYEMIDVLDPGSFRESGLPEPFVESDPQRNLYHFVYYSFVVLTTLGFGDITPLSQPARTATWLEAVVGQLYIAVIIGRLVGLQIIEREVGLSRGGDGEEET